MGGPTPRRLDILAAWWRAKGSNVGAARILNLSPQVVRNELHHLRREELVPDNLSLVQRYGHLLEGRELRPTVPRRVASNVT